MRKRPQVDLGLVDVGASQLDRARALAMWRAPVPPGLRAVHATWIEDGLAGLPARARDVVAGTAASPVDVWLARSATAHLPPMIVEPALAAIVGAHAAWKLVDGVPTAPVAALVAWLDRLGADQLAFAMTGASKRFAGTSQRAAIARCTGIAKDELMHVMIAARTLAPRLSSLAAHQLAVRLPRPVGLLVHDQLVAVRAVADVPVWPALLA
ncbi:MAG: hypothetical protein JO257_35845 [Deltaproteobacteria bacterium]|nr:hypothetical protein [Deltaproteobacteria bacterium]